MDKPDAMKAPRTLGCIIGIILLSALVASWFIWGPFGLIFYVDGLFNSLAVFLLVPVLFLLVPAAAMICLFVLTLRAALHGQELADGEKRRRVIWAVVLLAFVLSFALGTAGLQPSPFEMFGRGFARYAERRTDVAAIQNWLSTLDPNDCQDQPLDVKVAPGVNPAQAPKSIATPSVIAQVKPRGTRLMRDEAGRPMVRLYWGGGFIGHWGITVGCADMPIPPPRFSESGRNWVTLAPGAYVWSSD